MLRLVNLEIVTNPTAGQHHRTEDVYKRQAHICAAAQGGPRYDASMTPEERKSFENGIWLCQSCSKLIDTDITLSLIHI